MAAACARAGRAPSSVTLVGVSKGHDADEVRRRLVDEGLLDLGENRVQEWRDKAAALPEEVRWHFVGSLQRNKVKYLADGGVALVHSLNSARLADAMQAQGERRGHRFRALIEVDVAGEDAKQGIAPAEVEALLEHCRPLDHVEVVGLMAMAPFSDDPEDARPSFRRLRELADAHGLPERSMGMSGDFEVAIEEGATLIRVGTALFDAEADPGEGATR
jgi:pyridoxal phosphate enzyme (YggS family)